MNSIRFLFFWLLSFQLWAFEVPELTGAVIDQAGLLDSNTKADIESLARDYRARDIAQIQVLTVNDLQGEEIEQASIQIVDKWQLGSKEKDNGILLLVSLNPRKVRIEVGQGLEGDIPDVVAKRIIRDVMAPTMKSGNVSLGIYLGVREIIKYIEPDSKSFHHKKAELMEWFHLAQEYSGMLIVLFFIIVHILTPRSAKRKAYGGLGGYSGGFSSGGFSSGSGGDSWSGGGGGFSGGGSSGDW